MLESGVVGAVPSSQSSQVQPDVATVYVGDTAVASYGPVPPDGDPLTGSGGEFPELDWRWPGHVGWPG